MLMNYLKAAWRRLRKDKGFFALNFAGLYISVTACLLIALLIIYETSFDKGGRKDIQIFRVVNQEQGDHGMAFNAVTPYPLATAMRVAMPDEQGLICQIHFDKDSYVQIDQQVVKAGKIVYADSVFPRLFPQQVRMGSLSRAFAEPNFGVLTERAAQRFFGSDDVIGKRLKLNGTSDITIAAVVADPPSNSHLPYDILVSYPTLNDELIGGLSMKQWTLSVNGYTYIAFPAGDAVAGRLAQTQRVLDDLVAKNITAKEPMAKDHFSLQSLRSIHYNTDFSLSNPGYTINKQYLELIGAIGLFLILAACINYINLSTAMALKKAKEVGVRKTLGASRFELMRQLLTETFLVTAIVITAAALTAGYFLPVLNRFLDRQIPTAWLGWASGAFLLLLWIVVALLSGLYPAWMLSRFNPVTALKSKVSSPKPSVLFLRRGLVVFQFVTAQMLIICAIVVSKQMDFVSSQPLGFNKDLVVDVSLPNNKLEQARAFRARLADVTGVQRVSFSVGAPISGNRINTEFNRREDFKRQQFAVQVKTADAAYLATYGLQLAAGRWFDAEDEARVDTKIPDSLRQYAFVLNETAVRTLGFRTPQEALGKIVTFGFNNITAPVIGVVKDYHVSSMHDAVGSVLMVPFPFFNYNAGVQLSHVYSATTMNKIEKAFNEVYPDQLFDAHFLDADVAALYDEDRRTQQIFSLFTGLSIGINILGLIGLLAFMIEQKTKEVGIRKVLGASIGDISILLSKDFLRLIGIAFLVAAPVAGLLMDRWLRNFAYRTSLSWGVFVLALFATLVVTCVAISFQTLRAAFVNPVKSLRSE